MPLEHKPHFPTSEFHITIYDGKSSKFAKALLNLLRSFKWQFRVQLPNYTTLTTIEVKPRKPRQKESTREYSPILKRIFYQVTSEHLSYQYLANLSDNKRLNLCRDIYRHLRRAAADTPKISTHSKKSHPNSDKAHPQKHNQHEIHLTPPELAREIAEYAVSLIDPKTYPIHFGDPAVGTGAFYSALTQAIDQKQIASAIGIDISPQQVAAARMRWAHKGMEVILGDYLHMERLEPRTLILANPPYLRHQGIPKQYKHELRDRASVIMGMRVSARSGQYVYFMFLSHSWMEPNAVAAWLIPSEFMQTSYGAAVRHYLTHKVQLIRIHQFAHDDPQFENALVLPSVVVFRNSTPSPEHTALLSLGGTLSNPKTKELIPVDTLRQKAKWSIPMRPSRMYNSSDIYIRDIFTVRRGIATGANDFFVLSKEEAQRCGIPKAFLRPILPKARTLDKDIVERESDGSPLVTPRLFLLDCDLPENEIKIRYPRLLEYLKTAKDDVRMRYLVRRRHPWYKQESRAPTAFLCTYMGRHRANGPPVRFIWNKSDALVTNTYLMLYPREGLSRLLRANPEVAKDMFELLNETAQRSMTASWRVHAGGLHKIEPGDLLNVRLASNPQWLVNTVDPKLSTEPDQEMEY